MKKTKTLKTAALILCVILTLCCVCGCSKKAVNGGFLWSSAIYVEDTVLGSGSKSITVDVVADEKTVHFTIKTDADNLGDAIVDCGLVEDNQSDYGLYIITVNGIRADYDKDGAYWAVSKNGEYLQSGADTTQIANGEQYELTYTKS